MCGIPFFWKISLFKNDANLIYKKLHAQTIIVLLSIFKYYVTNDNFILRCQDIHKPDLYEFKTNFYHEEFGKKSEIAAAHVG